MPRSLSSLSSLVLVLFNASLIFAQEAPPEATRNALKWVAILFGAAFFIIFVIMIYCFCFWTPKSVTKELSETDKLTIKNTISNKHISVISNEDLDLENNWIADVYTNNNGIKKEIYKKRFYNLEINDSLQSVQLSSDDKQLQDDSTKTINKVKIITPPPFAYHPSSPTLNPTISLNVNVTKDLSEKALEYLANNPPNDILPSQAEIHSILKVQEDNYLNPYSPWRFIIEKSVIEESGAVQIINYGRIVEMNTRKWSSVTKDVCVQSNYPFFVPDPSFVRRNSISTPADRFKSSNNQIKRNSSNAIKPTPREEVIHYFEITVISKASDVDTTISIGLSTKPYPYFRFPGWNKYSVGYQSNNGYIYHNDASSGKEYAPTFTVGDTIGCGYRPRTNEIFFTKNGDYLGPYTTTKYPLISNAVSNDSSLQHIWYPTIAANGQCKLEINFGGEVTDGGRDSFKYKLARNYGPGAPLSIVKQLRGGELIGCYKQSKSENVELERVGLK